MNKCEIVRSRKLRTTVVYKKEKGKTRLRCGVRYEMVPTTVITIHGDVKQVLIDDTESVE